MPRQSEVRVVPSELDEEFQRGRSPAHHRDHPHGGLFLAASQGLYDAMPAQAKRATVVRFAGPGFGAVADGRQGASPELSPSEWRAVAGALRDAELGKRISVGTPGILNQLSNWARRGKRAPVPADPRREAVCAFVDGTRRFRQVDEALVEPLIRHGFNSRQVAALALLAL